MEETIKKIVERAKIQRSDAEESHLKEYAKTAIDRITLRIREKELPQELESVCVEITCALYNRMYHEGQRSETVDTFGVSFIDDIVTLYDRDFATYLLMKDREQDGMAGKVVFL